MPNKRSCCPLQSPLVLGRRFSGALGMKLPQAGLPDLWWRKARAKCFRKSKELWPCLSACLGAEVAPSCSDIPLPKLLQALSACLSRWEMPVLGAVSVPGMSQLRANPGRLLPFKGWERGSRSGERQCLQKITS